MCVCVCVKGDTKGNAQVSLREDPQSSCEAAEKFFSPLNGSQLNEMRGPLVKGILAGRDSPAQLTDKVVQMPVRGEAAEGGVEKTPTTE